MSAGVWHNCIGLGWNTKHLSEWLRVRGGGEHFSNNSQGLKWWILHACVGFICVDFIQFSTSSSASTAQVVSAAAAASATAASTVAASAAAAQAAVGSNRSDCSDRSDCSNSGV